jgi:ribosomal protein S18 acetylase RimI-like enzyme
MKFISVEKNHNEQIRELYLEVQNEIGTSKTFSQGILDKVLKNPHEYYSQYSNHMYVAMDNDSIIGFVGLEFNKDTNESEMQNIVVKSNYRRKDVGSRLLSLILKHNPIYFSCMDTNINAMEFYKSSKKIRERSRKTIASRRDPGIIYTLVYFENI